MFKQLTELARWFAVTCSVPTHGRNQLAAPEPVIDRRAPAGRLLLALVLVCFVPRAITAWRLEGLCPDAVGYLRMSQALERGEEFRLQRNIFPALLAGLHKLGVPPEFGGRVWGMLAGTLVVLPLFGWVRRQFDDRLAVIACLLYACHPELIEWCPEVIRDPTFWLFFTTALYLSWRAAAEISLMFYPAAGIAITLAVLTRFEGLFLLVPLVGWSVARVISARGYRRRLVGGAVLALAVLPALALVGNLVWASRTGRVETVLVEKLDLARHWIAAWWNPPQVAVPAMLTAGLHNRDAQTAGAEHWSTGRLLWQFVHQGERGLSPQYALLLLAGCLAYPRLLRRSDQLPMLLTALLACCGVWVHSWFWHLSSGRYFLTIAILATPTASLGFIWLMNLVAPALASWRLPGAAIWAPAAAVWILLAAGWADALSTNIEPRLLNIRLGKWINGHCGEHPSIVGVDDQLPVVAHYADGRYAALPAGLSAAEVLETLRQQRPDVVIFSRRHRPSECDVVLGARRELGLESVDELPDVSSRFVVLARPRLQR